MAVTDLPSDVIEFVKQNPLETSLIGGSAIAVGTATAVAVTSYKKRKKKKSKRGTKRKSSRRSKSRKSTRRRRTPRTAGKGRDRSTKRIRYTKNGQPYIILRSGKARFISNRSAKSSRKRKGGRY